MRDGQAHIEWAREAEKAGDFLRTRMEYLKAVESFRQDQNTAEHEAATKEYEEFVKRDPIFKKLVLILNAGIQKYPGILQSEITGRIETMNWIQLYNYERPLAKDDVYYALYFAAKFGYITRNKKGRSYELFSNGNTPAFESATEVATKKIPDKITYKRDPVLLKVKIDESQLREQEQYDKKEGKKTRVLYTVLFVSIVIFVLILFIHFAM